MTAFTVSSGGITEWDALTGGSVNATLDTYAISAGSTLRVSVDSYQCANHSTAFGSLDTVTFAGIGGTVLLDGTAVRVIAFTGGSGTVPAIGTSIVQGAVSGPLLGVWADWQSEPLAAAAAMPATGFIKIKSKTGGNFAAGALTGITATASGADVVGWIEVMGANTATITVPRIGKFQTLGDWFELGTTNGTAGQILACPTTGTVAGVFPGVWVETGVGTGIYERFPSVGSMANLATNPTDTRGKVCWQTVTGIRFGSDGVNTVGFLPPTGCKVRIPNVIMTCCTRTVSGSGPRVLPNAALATRQEFVTTAAGDISLNFCVNQWYGNYAQAYRTVVKNSAISDSLILQEVSSALDVDNVIVAPTQAQVNTALNMLSCFAGGTIKNSTFARFSVATGTYVCLSSFSKGVSFENVRAVVLLNRATTSGGTWIVTQNTDCSWVNCECIGGRWFGVTAVRPVITDIKYADNFSGATLTTQACYGIDLGSGTTGAVISGFGFFGLTNVHPYLGLVSITACYSTKLRNVGTYATPLNLGSANASGVLINGGGNNDNVLVQRCFVSNTRLNIWTFLNSDNNVALEQVKGDYADTSTVVSLQSLAKGVSQTATSSAQTSVYGTHWRDTFTSATTGAIDILCNEPTAGTAAQAVATGGTPRYNSSGQLALTAVGDQVTWEMSYFAKGHTALANLAISLAGTGTANVTYEFQYDKGAGYNGTWLVLNAANLTGAGAITPTTGVRLKARATCSVAGATNALTGIVIPTVTTSVDQGAALYPLDVNSVTFTGLPTGTDVVVLTAGTSTILASQDAGPGTTYSYVYSGAQTVDVGFIKQGFVPLYIRNLPLATADTSIPVAMTADRNYI